MQKSVGVLWGLGCAMREEELAVDSGEEETGEECRGPGADTEKNEGLQGSGGAEQAFSGNLSKCFVGVGVCDEGGGSNWLWIVGKRRRGRSVEAQELTLRKMRAFRGQVEQNKASNGNFSTCTAGGRGEVGWRKKPVVDSGKEGEGEVGVVQEINLRKLRA